MRIFPSTIAAAMYGAVGFPLFMWATNTYAARPSGDGWTFFAFPLMCIGFYIPVMFCCFDMQHWWKTMKQWWCRSESEGGPWELTGLVDRDWLNQCLPAWGRITVMTVSVVVSTIALKKFGITF